jgi:hypothetical protein
MTGIVHAVGKIGKLPGMAVGLVMGEGEPIVPPPAPDQGVDGASHPEQPATTSSQSDGACNGITATPATSAPANVASSEDTSTNSVVQDLPIPRCASADQSGMEALLRCPPLAAVSDRPMSLYEDDVGHLGVQGASWAACMQAKDTACCCCRDFGAECVFFQLANMR